MLYQAKPCVSLALGFGSVLSVTPSIIHNTKLAELSVLKTPTTSQNIKQHWQNVGGYIQHSVNNAREQYGR